MRLKRSKRVQLVSAGNRSSGSRGLCRFSVGYIESFNEETDTLDGLISYRNRIVNARTDKEYHSLTDRIIRKYDELLASERAANMKLQKKTAILDEKIARLEQRLDGASGI